MNKDTIISQINDKVDNTGIENKPNLTRKEKYPYWYIGITDDPDRRKQEHIDNKKNVKFWTEWPVDNEDDAGEIEKHFHDLRMKGSGGGSKNPTHVYIY